MAYQLSWVIQYQTHPCRRTVVILFKVSLFNGNRKKTTVLQATNRRNCPRDSLNMAQKGKLQR